MRLFAGCLAAETNTFSPLPTGLAAFEELGVRRAGDRTRDPAAVSLMLDAIHAVAAEHGAEVVEGLCACASPLGPVVRDVYERLRDELLGDIERAMPLHGVHLLLHGAMVADGYEDCEGDLLSRVRALVGPRIPIAATLDPHCHLTARMRASADLLVAFREYPHTDTATRAADTCRLLLRTARGELTPVMAVCDCPMVGLWPTTDPAVAAFVRRLAVVSGHGAVLDASFAHGFPWGDVAEAGARVWVIADRDPGLARDTARRLADDAWALRERGIAPAADLDAVLDRAGRVGRPLLIADRDDNPGGGAPGDHTGILARVLERGDRDLVLGTYWDPHAVGICRAAGVNSQLSLRIGGKTGPTSGAPVDVDVTVEALADEHAQQVFGRPASFGPSAWVRTTRGSVDLVLTSLRQQVLEPGAFTRLGVPLAGRRAIVVKSAHHFRAGFAPLAAEIVSVDAGGALDHDFARLPYRRRALDYFPRVQSPHRETRGCA